MSEVKSKPERGSTKCPDHIMVSISGDARTSMTVTWRTCTDIVDGYVKYRKEGDDKTKKVFAVSEVFESDIDISRIFWAELSGLEPDTKYFYTCGADSNRSGEYYFETEPENLTKFKFIAISDQQKGDPHFLPDYSYLNEFLKETLKDNPDVRFILTGGDNTDCGQHEVQWNGMFNGLTGIIEHLPYMMSLGNHDNRGFKDYEKGTGRYYAEPADYFDNQFKHSYPYNGPEMWKTENYSFNYGNVHFVIFGINGPDEVNEWAIRDIDASDKDWVMGTYHFPIYYSGVDTQNDDAYPMMRESMEKCDIMFSGHEHNFSRSFPIRNEEIFDRPSQGTIHYMLGNGNRNPPGSRTVPKVWHTAFYPQEEDNAMYALIEVDGRKVTITSRLNDGRIVDKCIIDKDSDTVLPYSVAPLFNRTRMMFKGMDLGLCQVETPPVEKDGIWYAPFATLIAYFGGYVNKTKDKVFLEAYDSSAEFTEGSRIAVTDMGKVTLEGEVFRGKKGQLYIPVNSACKIFGMKWAYAKRNNFISFEINSENHPFTEQP